MIYLAYFVRESGEPVWSFKHPLAPTELIAKIAGKDDALISGLIAAITGFGSETLGDRLQSIDFERYKLYFRYQNVEEKNFLIAVVCDKEDSVNAIWDVINNFINLNKKILLELGEELSIIDDKKIKAYEAKLNKTMLKLLEGKVRKFSLLAERDAKTILIGIIPAIAIFIIMFFVTQFVTMQFKLIESRRIGELAMIIIFLMFILPSLIMGIMIGFREGARKGGFILGALGFIALVIYYWRALLDWAEGLGLTYYLPFLLAIVIFVIGSAMGAIGSLIAWNFVEKKVLVPPRESGEWEALERLEVEEGEEGKILDEFSRES